MSDFTKRVGSNIKKYRDLQDMTMEQLGAAIGMSQPNISKIENGELKKVDTELIGKIANVLGVTIENIFEWDDEESRQQKRDDLMQKRSNKFLSAYNDICFAHQKEILRLINLAKHDPQLFEEIISLSKAYEDSSDEMRGSVCRLLDVKEKSLYRKKVDIGKKKKAVQIAS